MPMNLGTSIILPSQSFRNFEYQVAITRCNNELDNDEQSTDV